MTAFSTILPLLLLLGQSPPGAPSVAVPAVSAPAFATFEDGAIAFGRGEFGRAVQILGPLLYPEIQLESEGQVVQAHRMLGVAHLFESHPDEARQEFLRLLELRPDYRFDPLLDPVSVVNFFNTVLSEKEGEIAALQERARKAEQAERERNARKTTTVAVERHYAHHPAALNFVPFGAGQFQNGQRGKGWGFLAAEATLGAVSVSAFVTNFAVYGLTPRTGCSVDITPCPMGFVDRSDQNRSELLTQVQMISGGLFFAVAAWGIVDAVVNHRSLVPIPAPRETMRKPRLQTQVFPAVVGGGPGAGLNFRF
jgi:hypothetical protein